MKEGDTFTSFEAFEKCFERYKKDTFNEYYIRDAKTIETQRKRFPGTVSNINESLKYYYAVITCIRGGRKFVSKNENSLRNCGTYKQDCPAAIHLTVTKCKQYLAITKLNEEHNHTCDKKYFESLFQQRLKIPKNVKRVTKALLNTGANKKFITDKLQATTGCNITLKDLTNLKRCQDKKSFSECIQMLEKVYECKDIEILLTEEGTFRALFFQDERMKKYLSAFPEVLFIDEAYCLVDTNAAIYLVLVEDSNGLSEVVAVGLLLNKNEESIDFFIDTLKQRNPECEKTQVIMSDKEKTERKVFRKHFPQAKLMICLFHVFQIFHREVSTKKMDITMEEVKTSKQFLQKLTYASSEAEYDKIVENMQKNVPEVVMKYYSTHWADIKEQWVQCLTLKNLCLSNSSSNRLESINGKLKSVINRYSSLEDFIKKIFALINSVRAEKDVKNSQMLIKKSGNYEKGSPEYSYCDYLTSFAFEKVKLQMEMSKHCKEFIAIDENAFLAHTSEGLLHVSPTNCECMFRNSTMLPCRHIFKCRNILSMPFFDRSLCLSRWTKSECEKVLGELSSARENQIEQNTCDFACDAKFLNEQRPAKRLTKHEKFKLMEEQGQLMAKLCSEVSTPIFYQRLRLLKSITEDWRNGYDANPNYGRNQMSNSLNNESNSTVIVNKPKDEEELSKFNSIQHIAGTSSNIKTIQIKDIKMPIKMLMKRGRPKGCGTNVIGFAKKKCLKPKRNRKQSIAKTKDKERQELHTNIIYLEEEYLYENEDNIEEDFSNNNNIKNMEEKDLDGSENMTEEEYLNLSVINIKEEYLDEPDDNFEESDMSGYV